MLFSMQHDRSLAQWLARKLHGLAARPTYTCTLSGGGGRGRGRGGGGLGWRSRRRGSWELGHMHDAQLGIHRIRNYDASGSSNLESQGCIDAMKILVAAHYPQPLIMSLHVQQQHYMLHENKEYSFFHSTTICGNTHL